MKPTDTGLLYDTIASWWNTYQSRSTTGLAFVQMAIRLAAHTGKALDVGCGSGGRLIAALVAAGFQVTGTREHALPWWTPMRMQEIPQLHGFIARLVRIGPGSERV